MFVKTFLMDCDHMDPVFCPVSNPLILLSISDDEEGLPMNVSGEMTRDFPFQFHVNYICYCAAPMCHVQIMDTEVKDISGSKSFMIIDLLCICMQ